MKTVEITDHYAPRTTRGGLVQPMPGPRDLARAASHAPGIGGMKTVRSASPWPLLRRLPVPGQTIEDVSRAEAIFMENVAARHPDAEGRDDHHRQLPR